MRRDVFSLLNDKKNDDQKSEKKVGEAEKQAYLNDIKGFVFEFLFWEQLCRRYLPQKKIVAAIPALSLARLHEYQRWLYLLEEKLLGHLRDYAAKAALATPVPKDSAIADIVWIGEEQKNDEADVRINFLDGESLGLSLKLAKLEAMINTKSGGLSSFVREYFSLFPSAVFWQEQINAEAQESFELFQQGLSVEGQQQRLPSELSATDRQMLFEHYARLVNVFCRAMCAFFAENRQDFIKQLSPLVGFYACHQTIRLLVEYDDLHQVKTTVHQWPVIEKYLQEQLDAHLTLPVVLQGHTSFALVFPRFTLQWRIKPMNSFQTISYKLNMSVRSSL